MTGDIHESAVPGAADVRIRLLGTVDVLAAGTPATVPGGGDAACWQP